MNKRFRQFCFVSGFVAFIAVLSRLIVGESSPFHTYFIHHVGLPNLWRMLHLPPMILSMLASGNVHQSSEVAFIVGFILQWSVIGLVASLLWRKRFHTDDDHAAQPESCR